MAKISLSLASNFITARNAAKGESREVYLKLETYKFRAEALDAGEIGILCAKTID